MVEYINKWQAVANLMDAHLKDTAKAVDAIQYIPAADVVDRDEGIRMGVELAAMHGSDATSEDLERAFWRGFEEAMKKHDVRPVVLCKDCKHRPAKKDGRIKAPEDADGYTDYECPFVCEDSWYNRMPADDDYCSRGEKREES